MFEEQVPREKLPLKLTITSVFIAVAGLVLFMFNPAGVFFITPALLWGLGALLGVASPLSAFQIGLPQQAQFYFGVLSNCFFLAMLDFVVNKPAV